MGTYRALALVALLLLAGCSGLSPGDDGPPARTPYGVDDELEPTIADRENGTGDTGPARLAPGLSAAGVENVSRLLEGHYEALDDVAADNGTYGVDVRRTWRTENGTPVQHLRGMYVVDAPDRWSQTVRTERPSDDEGSLTEAWVEDGVRLVRTERSDGTVSHQKLEDRSVNRPLEGWLRSILLVASNATVEERGQNSTSWYRVTANVTDVDTVDELSFTVRDDGRVEEVTYVSRSVHNVNASVSEIRIQYVTPGPRPLERPDWHEEALEETGNETPNGGTPGDSTNEEPSTNGSTSEDPADDGSTDAETDDESSAEQSVREALRSVVRERTKR